MDRPSPFPPMTAADAQSIGFAAFNGCPHQTVDIPDGGFTLKKNRISCLAHTRVNSRVPLPR